jgi:tight adherence protein B
MRILVPAMTALAMGGAVAWALGMIPTTRPRRPWRRLRSSWLRQAGVGASPLQFWVASVGAAATSMAIVALVSGSWAIALVPSSLIGMSPRLYFAAQRRRRLGDLRQAWPDGLRDLVASISAGRSLSRALQDLASSGPAPLREAFATYPFLSRSLGTVAALEAIREEAADPTTDRVVEVLVVAHDRGGSIVVDILRDLAEATARDVWAAEEADTLALEHKINARAVFILPWVVLVAMTARPGPFRDFYATPAGVFVIAVGGVLSLTGAWIVSRLGRHPDEPRVLGGSS